MSVIDPGAPAVPDESLESTIMMSPAEAEKLAAESAEQSAADSTQIVNAPPPIAETDPNVQLTGDVPVPSLLSDLVATGSNITTKNTSEYEPSDLATSVEPRAEDENPAAETASDNAPVGGLDEPTILQQEPAIDTPAEDEVALPIAVDGSVSENAEFEEPPVFAEPPTPNVLAEAGDEAAEPLVSKPDGGIAKPSDDLSSFDSYNSQSMFDSVRIMEPGSSERSEADYVDTQLHPGSIRLDKPTPPTDPVETAGAQSGQIPSTSHNIGVGETDGKRSQKLKALAEGTILNGRYEIIRKIGGGGMGAVYLASDNNLGGVLRAVKEMVQTHIEEEQQEKAINDFKRESMILSSLDHVSIPTIYDYFYDEKESRFYLVMKYISGGDLSSRLRSAPEGRVEERTVCEWAVQIIDVLDYLHNQPSTIVYRDLKPSNIMIDGNSGRAMLIDFGIARSISQKEEKGVTAVGTMGYAPPELFSGNVEPRSDIYSLGSTMFHLLTGADPQSNPLLIFDFQKNPRPRQINSQLSDQMERIIMKAVQYNSDERFASAAEMRDVLEDHLIKLKAGIVTYGVSEVPASVSLANQSVFCGFCGQRIVATDMFCAFCGAKQPIAQQGVHAEIYSQSAWTAKLVVEGTSELTAPAFSLQKDDNLLGRRDPMSNIFPEVDLSKYDPQTKISRRHARIWREGNNFLVEDLGSSNGTILARSPSETFRLSPRQPQVLAAGDRIRVGDATLHFIIG